MVKPPISWRWMVAGAAGLALAGAIAPLALAQPSAARPLVFVEDSPEASDRFERARSLREQGRMAEAASAFQQIIDEFPNKLLETGGGTYIDAPVRVRQELSFDPALLEAYRSSFEPVAERELALALLSENQASALALVYQRYTLTRSGLKAAMALASLQLVRGEPLEAATELEVISSHPDLESVKSQWQLLQAASAVYSGQADRAAQYRKLLESSGDAQSIAQLKEWTATAKVPVEPSEARAKLQFPPTTAGPIWDRRLNEESRAKDISQDEGGDEGADAQRPVPGRPWTGVFPVLPVGVGDAILIDNNRQIRALDRFSGRELWVYSGPEDDNQINGVRPWQRMNAMQVDQRGVATDGFRAVAVLGTPSFAPMGIMAGQSTSLNCVAVDDGRLLWRTESKDFDQAFASAGFIGTPMIDRHRVYALLKRSQNSGDQYTYIVAVDLATGKPVWRRTLSTSPMTMMFAMARYPRMTLEGDRLFVTDSSSVAACVDCATGAFSWLNITQDPSSPIANPYSRSFSMSGPMNAGVGLAPIHLEAGLLVPGLGPGRSPLLLDPKTGKRISKDLNDGTWPDVVAVKKIGDDLLVVGSSVRLISGRTFEARWSKSLSDLGEGRPIGQPTIEDGQVVLPMHDRAVAVRIADGTVAWQLLWLKRITPMGNLLWMDGQLIGANDDSISSYMNWDMAYQSLKGQIVAAPYDPRPALALAQLAITSNQKQAALEGADLALEALRHMPPNVPPLPDGAPPTHPHQHEVFQQLLGFAEPGKSTDNDLRQAMFDRMNAIAASSPSLEVRYRMSHGAFLNEIGKAAQAVDEYQAVLSDKTLASQMFESVPASRRAGTEAKVRLRQIIDKSGVGVYAKYDAIASRTLVDCKSRTPVDTDGLISLSEEYPFAKASEKALVAAAEALAPANPRMAIGQLNRAYLRTSDPAEIQLIVGRLVQLHTDSGQSQRAVGWLERLRREHKGLDPLRDGKPIQIGTWLTELQAQKQTLELPALVLPMGKPMVVAGRLLVPTAQEVETWPRDRFLVCEPTKLKLLAGAKLQTVWEAGYNTASMRLLSMSGGQVVLWVEDSKLLLVLDAATGKPVWRAIQATPLMQEVGGDAEREASRSPEQRAFMEMFNPGQRVLMHNRVVPFRDAMAEGRSGFLSKVNDSVICLGDRAGRVVGIDRATGEVVWRFLCPMEQLNLMELGPDALVLGGITGKLTESQTGTVVVLDPLTGEMRLSPLEDKTVPRWVGLAGEGLLLHRTDTELVIRQISGDAPPKRIALTPQAGDIYTRLGSNTILVTDAPGSLVVYDADSAKVVSRVGTTAPTDPAWMQVDPIGQKWLTLTQTQQAMISPDGKVAWRDGVLTEERSYLTQLLGQKYVVLLSALGKPAESAPRQVVINGQMVEVWRAGGEPAPLVLPGNRGHVVRAIRNQPQNPNEAVRSFQYKAFILDRETGVLTSEISLITQGNPIDPGTCELLDHMLVFTAGQSTIVVPDGIDR